MMLIALMVIDRMGILREGAEVMLQTRPLDPRDFLRGDYVQLGYDMSSMDAGALKELGGEAFVGLCQARTKDRWFL